jgi:hypothetical protein
MKPVNYMLSGNTQTNCANNNSLAAPCNLRLIFPLIRIPGQDDIHKATHCQQLGMLARRLMLVLTNYVARQKTNKFCFRFDRGYMAKFVTYEP